MPDSDKKQDSPRLEAIKEGMAQEWQEEKLKAHHSPPADKKPAQEPKKATVEKAEKIEAFYDHEAQVYYRKGDDGEWQKANDSTIRRFLKSQGISPKLGDESLTSPLEDALEYIQKKKKLDYAAPLAGFPAGYREINGFRILVTRGPKLITPEKGEWPNLRQVLEGLLGEEQVLWFYLWLKVAVESLRDHQLRPGQALIIAGPPECGKSLLESLITVLLGGRMARPWAAMMGKTDFNSETFGAEHLAVDDEAASADPRVRNQVGSELKKITVTRSNRCHKKHSEALTLPTFWRLTIMLNDDAPSLQVLPILNEGIKDKIILLKAKFTDFPVDTSVDGGREKLFECLTAEFPAFVHFLMHEMEIPEDRKSNRFRVTHYHNPDLLSLMDAASDELKLLELIDSSEDTLFGQLDQEWEGKAAELEKSLVDEHGQIARRLFSYTAACGTLLGLLAEKKPDPRVEKLKVLNGYQQWRIYRLK